MAKTRKEFHLDKSSTNYQISPGEHKQPFPLSPQVALNFTAAGKSQTKNIKTNTISDLKDIPTFNLEPAVKQLDPEGHNATRTRFAEDYSERLKKAKSNKSVILKNILNVGQKLHEQAAGTKTQLQVKSGFTGKIMPGVAIYNEKTGAVRYDIADVFGKDSPVYKNLGEGEVARALDVDTKVYDAKTFVNAMPMSYKDELAKHPAWKNVNWDKVDAEYLNARSADINATMSTFMMRNPTTRLDQVVASKAKFYDDKHGGSAVGINTLEMPYTGADFDGDIASVVFGKGGLQSWKTMTRSAQTGNLKELGSAITGNLLMGLRELQKKNPEVKKMWESVHWNDQVQPDKKQDAIREGNWTEKDINKLVIQDGKVNTEMWNKLQNMVGFTEHETNPYSGFEKNMNATEGRKIGLYTEPTEKGNEVFTRERPMTPSAVANYLVRTSPTYKAYYAQKNIGKVAIDKEYPALLEKMGYKVPDAAKKIINDIAAKDDNPKHIPEYTLTAEGDYVNKTGKVLDLQEHGVEFDKSKIKSETVGKTGEYEQILPGMRSFNTKAGNTNMENLKQDFLDNAFADQSGTTGTPGAASTFKKYIAAGLADVQAGRTSTQEFGENFDYIANKMQQIVSSKKNLVSGADYQSEIRQDVQNVYKNEAAKQLYELYNENRPAKSIYGLPAYMMANTPENYKVSGKDLPDFIKNMSNYMTQRGEQLIKTLGTPSKWAKGVEAEYLGAKPKIDKDLLSRLGFNDLLKPLTFVKEHGQVDLYDSFERAYEPKPLTPLWDIITPTKGGRSNVKYELGTKNGMLVDNLSDKVSDAIRNAIGFATNRAAEIAKVNYANEHHIKSDVPTINPGKQTYGPDSVLALIAAKGALGGTMSEDQIANFSRKVSMAPGGTDALTKYKNLFKSNEAFPGLTHGKRNKDLSADLDVDTKLNTWLSTKTNEPKAKEIYLGKQISNTAFDNINITQVETDPKKLSISREDFKTRADRAINEAIAGTNKMKVEISGSNDILINKKIAMPSSYKTYSDVMKAFNKTATSGHFASALINSYKTQGAKVPVQKSLSDFEHDLRSAGMEQSTWGLSNTFIRSAANTMEDTILQNRHPEFKGLSGQHYVTAKNNWKSKTPENAIEYETISNVSRYAVSKGITTLDEPTFQKQHAEFKTQFGKEASELHDINSTLSNIDKVRALTPEKATELSTRKKELTGMIDTKLKANIHQNKNVKFNFTKIKEETEEE